MEDIKINKKLVFVLLLIVTLLGGALATGFYGYKKLLAKLPSLATAKLAQQGIQFKYVTEGLSRSGSSIDVYNFSLSGPQLPYSLSGKGIGIDMKFGFSPLLQLHIRLNHPDLAKNPTYTADSQPKPAPKTSSMYGALGALLKFTHISMEIVDASMAEIGINDLTATAVLRGIKFNSTGLTFLSLSHEMNLTTFTPVPWFPGLCWIGTTTYQNNKLEFNDHDLGLGLFATKLTALYDLTSQKWSADILIPDGAIKNKEQIASSSNAFWLTSASGEIGMKVSLQGVGGDTGSIIGQGTARAKDLVLGINHNHVRGNLTTNLELAFKKNTTFELAAKISTDLTDALVVNKDEFRKIKGVPLSFQTELEARDNAFQIKSAEIILNNLKTTLSGTWTYLPQKYADINFDIHSVNLYKWEQFFPKYPAMKAQGTLNLSGSYVGPTEDWKNATINLKVTAQKVKFPLLKIWNTLENFEIEGVTQIDSDTSLSLAAGSLKTLSTSSKIELKDTKVKYSTLFTKEVGTPLDFDLIVNSNKNQAEIKKGTFHLGSLSANAKGKITNFDSPSANLILQTDMLEVNEILKFLPPTLKLKAVEKPKGELAVKAVISGQLLSKQGPNYSADIEVKKLSFIYNLEEKKKKIAFLNVTGPLSITPNTLQAKKLFLQTSGSEGLLDLTINGFEQPDITFNFQGPHFTIRDFYEQDKPRPIEGVAVAAVNTKDNDFRKSPFVQKLKIKGDASIKSADLGYTKAENLNIKLNLDSLKLSVNPLSFNAFGGSIVSETYWDGTQELPSTVQNLKVTGVDSNQFLTSYSDTAKDVVLGKLSSNFKLAFSGLKASEMQNSMKGSGDFSLMDGTLKTIRFTKQPMEQLKKTPLISSHISKTDWDERFNDIKGNFTIDNGKILISNILFNSPYFEGYSKNATVGFDQTLQAVVTIVPKESMLPASIADIIRDETGQASLPLTLSGALRSPTIGLDTSILIPRTKNYLTRQMEKEKQRAVSNVKEKATDEAKKIFKGAAGGLFK